MAKAAFKYKQLCNDIQRCSACQAPLLVHPDTQSTALYPCVHAISDCGRACPSVACSQVCFHRHQLTDHQRSAAVSEKEWQSRADTSLLTMDLSTTLLFPKPCTAVQADGTLCKVKTRFPAQHALVYHSPRPVESIHEIPLVDVQIKPCL